MSEHIYHLTGSFSECRRYWHHHPCAHRVLKKTAKRIYVESCYALRRYACCKSKRLVFDREAIESGRPVERNGYAFTAEMPAIPPPVDNGADFAAHFRHRQIWLQQLERPLDFVGTLGLSSWPATVDDIRRAFRDKVKTAHPDRGGSSEAFIALKKAHDVAMAMVGGAA